MNTAMSSLRRLLVFKVDFENLIIKSNLFQIYIYVLKEGSFMGCLLFSRQGSYNTGSSVFLQEIGKVPRECTDKEKFHVNVQTTSKLPVTAMSPF